VRSPNTSDLVYNVGGYYEKYGFSSRSQYQRRSKWSDGIADTSTDAGDAYWADDDEMDFSARYAVNKHVEIYFDAQNSLNQPGRRFVDPSGILNAKGIKTNGAIENYTIEWERFGRRYSGAAAPPSVPTVEVAARGETAPVATAQGDAADDPATWRNPARPGESSIVGT
ncbi:hypothetical protein OY671_009975, partial [Metschnikowia pulcherrima]